MLFGTRIGVKQLLGGRSHSGIRPVSVILIAKSLVRLILCWVAAGPLHFERRKAVESSFRGPPATFPKHKPFGQKLLATAIRQQECHREVSLTLSNASAEIVRSIVTRLEIRGRHEPPLEHDMRGIYLVGAGFIPAYSRRFTIWRG